MAARKPIYPVPQPQRHLPSGPSHIELEEFSLARRFDGSNDTISCAIGGADLTGAFTMAVLVRKASNAAKTFMRNSGGGGAVALGGDASNRLTINTGAGAVNSTTTLTVADGWVLAVVTKAAGAAVPPNAHIFKNGAWTHEAMSGTAADAGSQAGGTVDFASLAGIVFYSFDLAVAGEWAVELSEPQVEELSANRATQDWVDNTGGTPQGLWQFNQSDTATAVTDLSASGADQTAIVGTEVITTGPLGWTYAENPVVEFGLPTLVQRPLLPA